MASARRRKDCFTSFLFVLPLLTLFLVFFAYPIIYNIVISFYDWNGISVEKVFVGFANYKKLWADSVMQKTFRNFVIIAISTTVIQSALGLMLASFFIRKIKFSGLYKILFYLPAICTSTIVGTVFSKIFETNRGYLNTHITLIILDILGALKFFDLSYVLTDGGPAHATETFSTYIYTKSFSTFQQGQASTIVVYMFLIAMVLTVIQLKIYYKKDKKEMS